MWSSIDAMIIQIEKLHNILQKFLQLVCLTRFQGRVNIQKSFACPSFIYNTSGASRLVMSEEFPKSMLQVCKKKWLVLARLMVQSED